MGAWGDKPDENDTAEDYLEVYVWEPLNKSINRLMRKRIGSDDSHEKWARIGVIYRLVQMPNISLDLVFVKDALWLDEVGADEEWVDSWKDRASIRRSISSTRRTLERWLEAH